MSSIEITSIDRPMARDPVVPEIDFGTDPLYALHPLMADLRERGPFHPVLARGKKALLVTRFEDVKAGFEDEQAIPLSESAKHFAEQAQGRSLFSMTGEEHRVHRSLIAGAFSQSAIDKYEQALIMPEARRGLDKLAGRRDLVDLVHGFTEMYPISVIVRILGLPPEDDEVFKRWSEELVSYDWSPDVAMKASREFEAHVVPIIHERREKPGVDVISRLATAEVEGRRLTDYDIVSFLRVLFPAGADTTFRSLGNLIATVLADPALKETLLADRALVPAAVDEALRWEPPIGVYPRIVPRDVEWRGAFIPAGTRILLGVASANRDPRVFDDPDRFDLGRRAKRITSFGAGIHYCIGALLAKREMVVGLNALLDAFPDLRLEEEVKIAGPTLRGPEALRVRLG